MRAGDHTSKKAYNANLARSYGTILGGREL